MRKYLLPALAAAIALYAPFLLIVTDLRSPWWEWLSLPGMIVQFFYIRGNSAIVGGTIVSFGAIAIITILSANDRRLLLVLSILAAIYAIAFALLTQHIIHAG